MTVDNKRDQTARQKNGQPLLEKEIQSRCPPYTWGEIGTISNGIFIRQTNSTSIFFICDQVLFPSRWIQVETSYTTSNPSNPVDGSASWSNEETIAENQNDRRLRTPSGGYYRKGHFAKKPQRPVGSNSWVETRENPATRSYGSADANAGLFQSKLLS